MKGFEPSLLDKLFDDDPRDPTCGVLRRLTSEQYKDSVARDVEALLNNRFTVSEETLKAFPQCQKSLATYGIRDFSDRSLASSFDRAYICQTLELAISRHEPRLLNVRVELDENPYSTGALRFLISALLLSRPSSEPIVFDAMLQLNTLHYSVSRKRRAAAM